MNEKQKEYVYKCTLMTDKELDNTYDQIVKRLNKTLDKETRSLVSQIQILGLEIYRRADDGTKKE